MDSSLLPYLGFGLGLRPQYYSAILEQNPPVDWFEIISENYMVSGGKALYYLDQIRERYPLVMHGVSLSLGGTDVISQDYLQQLKKLMLRIKPAWVSDHLCWTSTGGHNTHDLLPLPYTQETVQHVVSRIKQVQNYLERPLLIENVSTYLNYKHNTMSEWDFLNTIVEEADCQILLDVNNIYVSSVNHGFDPKTYIDAIASHRVQQIHLAGHTNCGEYIIDTHDAPIVSSVWDLYEYTLQRMGDKSTMIERDDHFPTLGALLIELENARQIAEKIRVPLNNQISPDAVKECAQ